MGDSEVFVVTWHGEKGCAENVRAIDRRRERPLINVVTVAVVRDDGIETDVLSITEICEVVSKGDREGYQRSLDVAGASLVTDLKKGLICIKLI